MGAVMDYLDPTLRILNGMTTPLKVAWAVWLLWGLAQLAWHYWPAGAPIYRTAHLEAPEPVTRPVTVRRPTPRKPVPPPVAPYGTSDFIAALDREQAAMGSHSPNETSAYR